MRYRAPILSALVCFMAVKVPAWPAPAIYDFDEAVRRGVVDFIVNPWANVQYDDIIANLPKINPGLVNRLGFQYGGVTLKKLDYTGDAAKRVHQVLPSARIGGGFPENLKTACSEKLPCDDEADLRTFSRPEVTSRPAGTGGKYYWIDPSLAAAQDYYICVGKTQVRRGFTHFHFEKSDNILKQSASRLGSIAGYARVRDELIKYGKSRGVQLSFSGEPDLAREVPLDSLHIPARLYEETFAQEYPTVCGDLEAVRQALVIQGSPK